MDRKTRAALTKRAASAAGWPAHDPRIEKAWANFLRSKPRDAVSDALDVLFHRKCAYCEAVAAQDIEHHRPKSLHPERMFDWQNLLRGCKNCNNAKHACFPLDAASNPLLLDPCADDPLDFFVWDELTGATGVRPQRPYKERGEQTRDLLGLDAQPLREERRTKLQIVRYLLARVVNEEPVSDETKGRLRDELAPSRPWLGIVRQLLRPGRHDLLLDAARRKLPDIDQWVAGWL